MSNSSGGVDIIIRDLALNPSCTHGPTILFSSTKDGKKFFSCAGVRTKECFYLEFDHFSQDKLDDYSHKKKTQIHEEKVSFSELKNVPSEQRIYCKTCGIFIETIVNHETHVVVKGISDELLNEPSVYLPQLDDDKFNAQYYFDESTLEFICSIFESLEMRKIVCIGAPRLHDYIKVKKPDFQSILLDIDSRFQAFNVSDSFIRYNMFNHHFFDGPNEEKKLRRFLKDDDSSSSRHCLFTDPPFAARTELLTATIQAIKSLYQRTNHHKILPIMWIFPYFNESHIQHQMPEMEMLDFQVSYMNHRTFRDNYKGRKEGSPIRIFTNISPTLVKYPLNFTKYRFCKSCKRYVSTANRHCQICGKCPSKNGSTYRHCPDCILCVKPNYVHCKTCNRCVQQMKHDCVAYQSHQECWFCSQRGHVEKNCQFMKRYKKRKDGNCVVCKGKQKHNLRCCPSKQKYLENIKN